MNRREFLTGKIGALAATAVGAAGAAVAATIIPAVAEEGDQVVYWAAHRSDGKGVLMRYYGPNATKPLVWGPGTGGIFD